MTGAGAIEADANRRNLLLLITLRWLAVAGQVATIAIADLALDLALPLQQMGLVIVFLVGLNLISLHRVASGLEVSDSELCVELLLDVAALTLQLYLSGGATNPFISLYLLQVILAAVLLPPAASWAIVAVTSLAFVWLSRFYRPLDLGTTGHAHGASTFFDLHLQGMFLCFLLAAVLVVLFVTRITGNLRERDAHLAEMRQRAAEEEHIVRMGLLATGAAHELGTPLATLSVILNDWEHLQPIAGDGELAEDLEEMQAAIARCKSIVSQILLAAGEARPEETRRAALAGFLDEMVARWREARRPAELSYRNGVRPDLVVACDGMMQQMLFNVLDNALEASPGHVDVEALQQGDDILVRVRDAGSGFAPEALAQIGKPYQSTKPQPGRGLGLFLSTNVLRKLGGGLSARNLAGGGACVELRLPVAALAVEDADAA